MKHLPSYTRFLLICLSMYLLISCETSPETISTTLRGKLTAANSNRVLPNAKIDLVHVNFVGYTQKDIVLDSTYSDSLGDYSFVFQIPYDDRYEFFQLVCYYPNYYSTRDITGPTPLQSDKHFELGGNQVYNPELHPYAWVKIQCDLDNSYIRLDINSFFGNTGASISNPGQESFFLKAKGNAWNQINHFLYRDNGDYIILNDSVYCGNNDTTTFIINN